MDAVREWASEVVQALIPDVGPGLLWVIASTGSSWVSETMHSGTSGSSIQEHPADPEWPSSSILDSTVDQNQVTLPFSSHTMSEHKRASKLKHLRMGQLVLR